jgi:hypothetical protein
MSDPKAYVPNGPPRLTEQEISMAASAAPLTVPVNSTAPQGSKVVRRYRDSDGSTREMIARSGHGGSTLVLDRDLLGRGEERLVAHLSADEPSVNIGVVCRSYLDAEPQMRRCRALRPEDEVRTPMLHPESSEVRLEELSTEQRTPLRLVRIACRMTIPELRWVRLDPGATGAGEVISLREAIAATESYEPLCRITRSAVERCLDDETVSTAALRTELNRVLESPIVLNRGLREAVMSRIAKDQMSMSEIAIRCGRRKRDSKGNESGETSWLARRIGLLPEGGQPRPTRWVHSDVLGLIAWQGLGIAPREVELG